MIATINWVTIQWTPKEIAEFIEISNPKVDTTTSTHAPILVRPCWPRSITPSYRWWWNRNPSWKKWNKVWTVSLINWARVEYKNQAVLAKFLWIDPAKISKIKNTTQAIRWYYITTKHQ